MLILRCAVLTATLMLAAVIAAGAQAAPAHYPPTPPSERRVGIAYSTWHVNADWGNSAWGTPLLGSYKSDDVRVIRQHAAWLASAGVDFIWIDWSNNIQYTFDPNVKNPTFDMIEGATHTIFEQYAEMRAEGKNTPNISIFAGVTSAPEAVKDGRLQRKVDQIAREYVDNPRYRPLLQTYLGKPLLVIYVNTPSPFQDGVPAWTDPRFTVRWMTGYVTEQGNLRTADLISKYGYWSWEDRGPQTYTVYNGHPEAMVVLASYRAQYGKYMIPAAGRMGGETFRKEWARADAIGPKFAMVVSWNEWSRGEQPSAEISKDIEPSKEFGMLYLNLLKEEIHKFKTGK